MKTLIVVKPLDNTYCQSILNLILPIQQIEFNVAVTLEGQPDLLDIENFYIKNAGGFWGAFQNNELVGTIALISIGSNAGAIRKMFVKKEVRGKEIGVAQMLFDELEQYCQLNSIETLYLGTIDVLKAAHRFYEKNNFKRLTKAELPNYFPTMMGENVYYYRQLKNISK